MRTLTGQNVANIDQTDPTNYTYGRAKDASPGNNDGTQLLEKTTITDTTYPFLKAIKEAGLTPNEAPENINNSQVFDAFMRLFGNVGEIVAVAGDAALGRYLLLNGAIIDLSIDKFKYLREWVEHNQIVNPSIFVDKNIADPQTDRGRFKIDLQDSNYLGLPFVKSRDSLRSFGVAEAGLVDGKNVGDADNGDVQYHSHAVQDFTVNLPSHTHTLSSESHSHSRGTMEIIGSITGISPTFNSPKAQATGVFLKNQPKVSVYPVVFGSASGFGYGYGFGFQASRSWTGLTSSSTHTHTVTSAIGSTSTTSGVVTANNASGSNLLGKNVGAGITVKYYIKF